MPITLKSLVPKESGVDGCKNSIGKKPQIRRIERGRKGKMAYGGGESSSVDPLFHVLRMVPYSIIRPPNLRLKLPSLSLPSPMSVYALVLLTYFMVVSGIVYDVIVEPPGIGSTQDRLTGSVRPVVFLSGRVNGQYIIEGLSSGFMFILGGLGIVLLDLALDRNRAKSLKLSYASAGISSLVIAYLMSMLFIRIKIPAYLS